MATATSPRIVDTLNSLLRGELSAVETYSQAIAKTRRDGKGAIACLDENRRDHATRASQLTARIRGMGGEPATGSGAWGAFARLVQGGAGLFGRDSAIAALEEGEDQGLSDYRKALDDVDADTASFLRDELLPGQQRSHDLVKSAKDSAKYAKGSADDCSGGSSRF